MLSFFRKYEKTFFLIVFVPAVIGMGITGVVVSVLAEKPAQSPGKVFGKTVDPMDWESVIRPRMRLMGREESQDDHFRYFAYVTAAKDAGLRLPDGVVADKIIEELRFPIAQLRAADRIRREGIDPNTKEGQDRFRQYYIEYLTQAKQGFTEEEYQNYVRRIGMSIPEYEAYKRLEATRQTLFDVIRHAGTVTPEEIKKEIEEKEQKREAEIVTLEAAAYVPSGGITATDKEAEDYYNAHKELYDEPRKVNLEYVASPFEKARAEVQVPTEEAIKEYYEKHRKEFETKAGVGTATVAIVRSLSQVSAEISEKLLTQRTHERAQNLLEQVAAKLDAQRKTGKVDLRAACDAVAAANTNTTALVHGETNLLEDDAIMTHVLLNGFAAYRWATTKPASETETSDPLKGEKCVAILRTKQVKDRTSPAFADVKEQVKKDYVEGGERELKKYYDANQWKYRTKDRWKLAYVTVDYARFAKEDPNVEDPTDAEVAAFWQAEGAKRWPGKDVAAVGSEAIKLAAKEGKAKDRALNAFNKFRDAARAEFDKNRKVNPDLFKGTVDAPGASFVEVKTGETLDREALAAHPILSKAEAFVPLAELQNPSEGFDRPDGRGKFFVIVTEKLDQKTPELAEVREQVQKDVLIGRGYERAKQAAEALILELKDLRGEALSAAVKAKGLEAKKSGLLARNSTVIPGVGAEGSQITGELFNCEVEGGYEHSVNADADRRVYLVRCARRELPQADELARHRTTVRAELLRKKREEFAQQRVAQLTLDAKGISREHVEWVRARRDGPNGEVSTKVRQIFVPNDKATIDRWLEEAARKRIDQAFGSLQKGAAWDKVVAEYSEDEATRMLSGQLEAARGQLVNEYGVDFESTVFALKADDQVSVPLKSRKGFHLVRVKKTSTVDDGHGHGGELRVTFQHLLVKTDPKLRNLPKEELDKAKALAEAKIKEAKARLDKGEPFAKVATEAGAPDDARAKGEPFAAPWTTPMVRALLRQPLEPIADLQKLEPFEVEVATAGAAPLKEWHLALCARDPQDKEPVFKQHARAPRIAYEVVSTSKDTCTNALKELVAWRDQRIAENRDPSFHELLREWKKIVARSSSAVTKDKEGAFGLVGLDSQLRDVPEKVLEAYSTGPAGKRSDVIATDDGFYVVEVVSVETKPKDDGVRFREIADDVLRGTDWVTE